MKRVFFKKSEVNLLADYIYALERKGAMYDIETSFEGWYVEVTGY